MTAYADASDFEAASSHLDLDAPSGFQLDALLDRAADDIDAYLDLPVAVDGGDRLDVETLTDGQREALALATAQQAYWRLIVGEEDVSEGRPRLLGIDGVSFASDAPDVLGPEARRTLSRAGLLVRTGTVP